MTNKFWFVAFFYDHEGQRRYSDPVDNCSLSVSDEKSAFCDLTTTVTYYNLKITIKIKFKLINVWLTDNTTFP